jgi:hypothetical protein
VVPALGMSTQFFSNAARNLRGFLSGRLNLNNGMKELIDRFYRSITDGDPLPIPYREILLTSRIMDAVFEQLAEQRSDGVGVPRDGGSGGRDSSSRVDAASMRVQAGPRLGDLIAAPFQLPAFRNLSR